MPSSSSPPVPLAQPRHRKPAILGGEPAFAEDVFVTRPIVPDREAYSRSIAGTLDAAWLTNDGPLVRRLEQALKRRLEVEVCRTFSSGTAALLTALRALDLSGRVVTTPFTFPATPHCIAWNGLEPVFCDIDPRTYNLDVARVEEAIDEHTSAILAVHVFGNPCAVDALADLAQRRGLALVYDAAHAFDVHAGGRPIGSFGDVSAMSFHATKVFHTAEGGALVSSGPRLDERIALLRNFGIVNENEVQGVGLNGKLSELHAALGLLVLDRVEDEIARRGRLVERYRARLEDAPGIRLQAFAPDTRRNYFNFTIEIDEAEFGLDRDTLHEALRAERVVGRKYFHPLCSDNPCYRALPSAAPERLPNARGVASRIMSLPLHGALDASDVDAIADAILAIQAHAPHVRTRAIGGPPS